MAWNSHITTSSLTHYSNSNSGSYYNTISVDSSKFDDCYKQFNSSGNVNNAVNGSIETQQFDVIWKDINRNIRINFSNLESFYLYSIKFYGNTADKCLCCDSVQFNYFDFDASDNNYIGNDECPSLTPLFGPIYLEIAKLNLIQSLHYLHKPFIVAIRNILLSPFIIIAPLFFQNLRKFHRDTNFELWISIKCRHVVHREKGINTQISNLLSTSSGTSKDEHSNQKQRFLTTLISFFSNSKRDAS